MSVLKIISVISHTGKTRNYFYQRREVFDINNFFKVLKIKL